MGPRLLAAFSLCLAGCFVSIPDVHQLSAEAGPRPALGLDAAEPGASSNDGGATSGDEEAPEIPPPEGDRLDASPDEASSGESEDGELDASLDAAPDVSPWTPAELDQRGLLAIWLEATPANVVAGNGTISTWIDQSRNKNDAILPFIDSQGPIWDGAAIHGHDAVAFRGHGPLLCIPDAPSLQLVDDDFDLVAVIRSVIAGGYVFSKTSPTISGAGPAYGSGLEFFVEPSVDGSGKAISFPAAHLDPQAGDSIGWGESILDDALFHIVALRRITHPTVSVLSLTVDAQGPRNASTLSVDISQVGQPACLGDIVYGNVTKSIDFSLAEVLLVHATTIADSDVAPLMPYLRQKYGLSP